MRVFSLLLLLLITLPLTAQPLVLSPRIITASEDPMVILSLRQDFREQLSPEILAFLSERHQIRVGIVAPVVPPAAMVTVDNMLEGINADWLSLFSAVTGWPIILHYFNNAEQALTAMSRNEVDFLNITSFPPEVKLSKVGKFSRNLINTNYFYLGGIGHQISMQEGTRIAYVKGTVSESELRKLYPHAIFVPFNKSIDAFDAAYFGKADFFLGTYYTIRYLNGERFGYLTLQQKTPIKTRTMSFFVSNHHPEIFSLIDDFIYILQDSGYFGKMLLRWRGGMAYDLTSANSKLGQLNEKWLNKSREVRVGLIKDNIPFSFINSKGQWEGILIEVLDYINKRSGLQFEYVAFRSRKEIETAIKKDQIDIIGSVRSSQKPSDLIYSIYYNFGDALVKITSNSSKKNNNRIAFAVQNSQVLQSWLKDKNYTVYKTETDLAALQRFETGLVDSAVVSLYMAEYYDLLSKRPYNIEMRVGPENIERYFAARPENEPLIELLNEILASTPPAYLEEMAYSWRTGPLPSVGFYAQYEHIIIPTVAIFIPVLILYLVYSLRLRSELKARKKAEIALLWQLDFMQELLDGLPYPVMYLRSNGTIVFCNKAFSAVLNRQKIDFKDQPVSMALSRTQDLKKLMDALHKALLGSVIINQDNEIEIAGKNIEIQEWLIPYHDEDGTSQGVFWGWFDVTWRNEMYRDVLEAKQQAELANQSKSEFIATISHEIRTPINIITGFVDIFYKSQSRTDNEREELNYVRTAANNLLELVKDVLDVIKIESDLLTLNLQPIVLNRLLRDTVDIFFVMVEKKGVQLVLDLNLPPISRVLLDPLRTRQIIYNILSNAVKFTTQGTISVSAMVKEDFIELCVEDTGIGIAEDKLDTLFQPFVQAHHDHNYQGSGLGLNIARRLCELMGGTIALNSTFGIGTTITVRLPFQPVTSEYCGDEEEESAASTAVQLTDVSDIRVLIVDDHPANLRLLQRQLQLIGVSVLQASSGKEALELLQHEVVDAIITDCQMPAMNGFELARQVRERELRIGCDRLIIIGLTASGLQQDKRRAHEAGMDKCLFKPIDFDGLCLALLPLVDGLCTDRLSATQRGAEAKKATMPDASLQNMIMKTSRDDLAQALVALSTEDFDTLSSLVHRIKGPFLMIKEQKISQLCEAIEEELMEERNMTAITDHLREIQKVLEVY